MEIKFARTRTVKSPMRAHSTDAGVDFFIPEDLTVDSFPESRNGVVYQSWDGPDDTALINDGMVRLELDASRKVRGIVIRPQGSVLIPLGVKVSFPDGHALVFFNKSGVAAKKHLVVGSCVVDSGYQGELILNLNNIGGHPCCTEGGNGDATVCAGDKIVQGILLPVVCADMEEVPEDGLYSSVTGRGEGGFGSSGVK